MWDFRGDYKGMFKNTKYELILAFMPNRLTPHLLKEIAGLSEDLLESYGDSWGFVDEGVLILGFGETWRVFEFDVDLTFLKFDLVLTWRLY